VSGTATASDEVAPRGIASSRIPRANDDLPNSVSVPPATIVEMRRLARDRNLSILSYWVGRTITRAWLLRPDGEVLEARVEVDERRLDELVGALWRAPRQNVSAHAARELHRLIVAPLLRGTSTRASADRILIVPHGPLAGLSFAALQDAEGRYLVEDHTLSYAPAVSVVISSASAAACCAGATRLLVGSPRVLPHASGNERLQPLPGARRELAAVGGVLGPDRVVRLEGTGASEAGLRTQLGSAAIVHLATHGVMLDDAPLDSYLALDASGARADGPDDGRLTAREVYDLELHADLVVLSACRTGLGKASGDGLLGFARAFFYAGAGSVVATLWDVADEPAARLMPMFYRSLAITGDPSRALRAAQLSLLADLRRGRVVVRGRRGQVPLPDHPSLWASFVVMGLPR
jgi:CHAT domain-containing protein